MIYTIRRFSKIDDREDAPKKIIEKAKTSGVVQKVNGKWRIVSIKKGKLWSPVYKSKKLAKSSLSAYHASKGFSVDEDKKKRDRYGFNRPSSKLTKRDGKIIVYEEDLYRYIENGRSLEETLNDIRISYPEITPEDESHIISVYNQSHAPADRFSKNKIK